MCEAWSILAICVGVSFLPVPIFVAVWLMEK